MLISDWSSDVCSSDLAKIAIDDTGAGHASLQHVFRIQPDYIKLDRRLVRHLHHDRSIRALLASAVAYAGETGATVIAEGVETDRHLEAVRKAGVELAQGYLLGRDRKSTRLNSSH